MEEFVFWLTGVTIGLVTGVLVVTFTDSNFEFIEQQYKEGIARCEALGSSPVRSDKREVTCENGITLNLR